MRRKGEISMKRVPSQCNICLNFDKETLLCKIHEQLPGEYGREDVKDCPSFLEEGTKDADDLKLLMQYIDEDPTCQIEENISKAVDRILADYENKYKIMIVGIARRKIKSIIKMVDIIDAVLDKMNSETIAEMAPSQAIRLLSELNSSVNNDLTFIMKLVNPDTKLQDLQMWIDARSVINISGSSKTTDMKADEILKLSGASRDKIRDAFDALLHQIDTGDDLIEVVEVEGEDNEE